MQPSQQENFHGSTHFRAGRRAGCRSEKGLGHGQTAAFKRFLPLLPGRHILRVRAVVLIFLIINHETEEDARLVNKDRLAEIRLLDYQVQNGEWDPIEQDGRRFQLIRVEAGTPPEQDSASQP